MKYTFEEHKHRYATWTAARAVQRSFTTTANISSAIESTSLRNFAESTVSINQSAYDLKQKQWCNAIIHEFKKRNIDSSYGRSAKIVAIYLKTSLIMGPNANSETHRLIHPPIDSILLKSLSSINELKDLKFKRWTKLDENNYWLLANRIREHFKSFDWRLEAHWKPELES